MKRCLEFGRWVDALRGELSGRDGFRAAVHLSTCGACRRALADARRLDPGLGPPPLPAATSALDHDGHEDLVRLAEALARAEFPPDAWRCEACSETLIASLVSIGAADSSRFAVSTGYRRARFRLLGGLAAAAAVAFAVLAVRPASQEWARSAGLRRGQVWLLPGEVVEDVRRVASGGALSPPRFTLPSAPIEIERAAQREALPLVLSPRWEMSARTRPEFRWSGSAARVEIFVLDGDLNFLWNAESEDEGRLPFPATAAPLVPGATYYWKVNLVTDDGVRPSAYAGFTVLTEEEARRCLEALDRTYRSRFVEGVVAERCGLYTRAAESFEAASRSMAEPGVAPRLARELRRRQGLEDDARP